MDAKLRILRMGLMLTILLGSMISITAFIPQDAEAISTPVVNIKWAEGQEVQEADVKPGESGLVTFSGTVSADIPMGGAIQDIIVNLIGSTDMGWPVVVTPTTVLLQPGTEEKPISCTVAVTSETSYYVAGTLTLSGTATAFPGTLRYNILPVQATIKIKQYYRFSIGCSKPYVEVAPSERLVFNLQIINEGNARDKYGIEIKNLEKISKDAWTVTLSRQQIEIPEKNEETVQIPVGTPIKFNLWINEVQNIEVVVKSVQEELNEGFTLPQTFILTVRQRGFSTPGFDPIFLILALAGLGVIIKTRGVSKRSHRRRRKK